MRIGLAIETDLPGGAETVLLQLASELRVRGNMVVPIGFSGTGRWLTDQFSAMGIERMLLDVRGPFGLGSVPQITEVIRDHRLDVLHSHEFGFAVCGAIAARLTRCRHVITIHGGTYYGDRMRRRAAFRAAMRASNHTVAVSHALRGTMADRLDVQTDSLRVVHNGVSAPSPEGTPIRAELGVGDDDVLALAVGSLFEVKGHHTLLKAVAALSDHPVPVVVAIAGQGHLAADLEATARRLQIEDKVRFLGFRTDVQDLLSSADIFVMPSLMEGLPMAMIEAMLAGKAILATAVGGIPELIPGPDYGVLVPPEEPSSLAAGLAELARDPDLRTRLGARARKRANRDFTAAAMATKYLSLYRA